MDTKLSIILAFGVLFIGWEAYAAFNCTSAGRFPSPGDSNCKNYTLCVYVRSNRSFVLYNYTCPSTSVFNPSISVCTDPRNYSCNTTNNATTICTEDGNIPDPSSPNCTSFVECVKINDTFTETRHTCPDDTFFNQNTTNCEFDYNCSTKNTTKFSCSATGRFANSTDITCKTYYLCVMARNGTINHYGYKCPSISVFSPSDGVCTTSYECPTA